MTVKHIVLFFHKVLSAQVSLGELQILYVCQKVRHRDNGAVASGAARILDGNGHFWQLFYKVCFKNVIAPQVLRRNHLYIIFRSETFDEGLPITFGEYGCARLNRYVDISRTFTCKQYKR